jgi:hypothetical protein
MKKNKLYLYPLYLILVIFILSLCNLVAAQRISPLNPPKWSVGDWWIVECQVYDYGEMVSGPHKPGWGPKQTWRFQVDSTDSIEGQPYFVVSIRPMRDNSCPYWFRYWFRTLDLYVGRYELYHPIGTGTKIREIGPPVVTKNFSPMGSNPFFSNKFPTLPMTVPLFNLDREFASFSASGGKFETFQETTEADPLVVEEKADWNLLSKIKTGLMDKNRLVTIRTASNIIEQQYWTPTLPWSVYGERYDKADIARRYWLVEVGQD